MNLTWVDTLSEDNANFVKAQLSAEEKELTELQKGPKVQSKDISSLNNVDYETHFKSLIAGRDVTGHMDINPTYPATGTLLEIGPYLGKSTVAWAEVLPGYKIHAVDLFMGINKGRFKGIVTEDEQMRLFATNIAGREQITYEKAFFYPHYIPPEGFEKPTIVYYDGLPGQLEIAKEYWKGKTQFLLTFDYEQEKIVWL